MGVMFNKGLSPATISSRLSDIAFWHKLYASNDPTDHFLMRRTLVGLRKERPQMDPRPPLTLKNLHTMCQGATVCDWAPYDVVLFQAIITLSFHDFLYPGEMTESPNSILYENVHFSEGKVLIKMLSY